MATVNAFQFRSLNIFNVTETHVYAYCRYVFVVMNNIGFLIRVCHCGNYVNKEILIKIGLNPSDIGDGVEIHVSPSCKYNRTYNDSTKTFTLTRMCYCPK